MVRRFLVTAALLAAAPLWADTILLKDGRIFTGTVARTGTTSSIKTADGKVIPLAPDSIQKVTMDTALTPAELAGADWGRTQVKIKTSTNLSEIIGLLQGFVLQYPDSPLTPAASQALADFKQMKADNYVKLRDRWLPKDQAEVLTRQANDKARESLTLYTASKLKESVTAAQECLATNDENPTALMVLGLASFKLNQIPQSRQYFTKLSEVDSNSALAWNNLGVLAFQSHKELDAIGFYTKALQSAMDNRLILDNIADAMANFSGQKESPIYKGLERIVAQSEARVGAKMAQQGLYRYKSTWVTQDQRDRLGQSGNISSQLTQQQQAYNAAQTALTSIDVLIRKNTEAVQRANSDYASANSIINYNSIRGLYVDPYYYNLRDAATNDLQRAAQQRQALDDQRAQATDAMRKLKTEIDRLTALANAPGNAASSLQRLMEPGDVENPPPPAPIDIPPKMEATRAPSTADIDLLTRLNPATEQPPPQGVTRVPNTNMRILPDNSNNNGGTVVITGGATIIRK